MESTGVEGRIQVSQATFERLQSEYIFEDRGAQVEILEISLKSTGSKRQRKNAHLSFQRAKILEN